MSRDLGHPNRSAWHIMQQPYLCTYHTNKNDNQIGQKLYFSYVLLHTTPWRHMTGTQVIILETDHFCNVFVRPCVWRHTRYYKRDTPTPVVLDISSWERAPVDMLALNLGCTFQPDSARIPVGTRVPVLWKTGTSSVFDRKAYITMYVVSKTRSGQDRNLICFKITHLRTTQLTSFFLAALINVKIRIEEGQSFVRVVHQKTTQTQPAYW